MKNIFIFHPSMKSEADPRFVFTFKHAGPKKKMYRNFIDKSINQRGVAQGEKNDKNRRNAGLNRYVKYTKIDNKYLTKYLG